MLAKTAPTARLRATTPPRATTVTTPILPPPPADNAPWRTLLALVERLNAGAEEPSFSKHSLRHYVYQAECGKAPDLLPFIRRVGRKILISEPGFMHWLETRPSVRQ